MSKPDAVDRDKLARALYGYLRGLDLTKAGDWTVPNALADKLCEWPLVRGDVTKLERPEVEESYRAAYEDAACARDEAGYVGTVGDCIRALVAETQGTDGEITDADRINWLGLRAVNVRDPLVYGSRDLFWANPGDSRDGEDGKPSDLRGKIDPFIRKEREAIT